MTPAQKIRQLAAECGFQLAGIARALPVQPDAAQFLDWVSRGLAGEMSYLTDGRAWIRTDPRNLLPEARSIICLGRLYNTPDSAPIARYARTEDYHDVLRSDMKRLVARLEEELPPFTHRICVDTAPLLERSYARLAGLGWIGRNTCLIHQQFGSYIYLAEILISLDLGEDVPAPDRCGTCTRCIDACPTDALVPGGLRTELDSTRCISYFTIELKGDIPAQHRSEMRSLAFGCDICQEVCPWNRRAPLIESAPTPGLQTLAALSPEEFRARFRNTPLWRTKYQGLLRNVAVAMGNSGDPNCREPLEKLAASEDPVVQSHARWALEQLMGENNA